MRMGNIKLPNGLTWQIIVGGADVPSISIPIDQLEGMSAEDIGTMVLRCVPEAQRSAAYLFADESDYWFNNINAESIAQYEAILEGFKDDPRVAKAYEDLQEEKARFELRQARKLANAPATPRKDAGWRRRRMYMLAEQYGWQCHYCGTTLLSHEEIRERYTVGEGFDEERQQFAESYTVLPPGVYWPTLDHKIPVSDGGTNELDNLALCCHSCNSKKSNRYTYNQFVALMQQERKASL